jgi:hypothetical protein
VRKSADVACLIFEVFVGTSIADTVVEWAGNAVVVGFAADYTLHNHMV